MADNNNIRHRSLPAISRVLAIALLFCILTPTIVLAQFRVDTARVNQVQRDTTSSDTAGWHMKKNPTLALVLSAVLPGAGQVYCDQWWKVPIIYGAIGGLLYGALLQNSRYHYISDSVNNQLARGDIFDANRYASAREFYHDDRDKYYIYASIFYIANLIDAVISAHLYDFDVSDEDSPPAGTTKSSKFLFAPADQHVQLNFHYHF